MAKIFWFMFLSLVAVSPACQKSSNKKGNDSVSTAVNPAANSEGDSLEFVIAEGSETHIVHKYIEIIISAQILQGSTLGVITDRDDSLADVDTETIGSFDIKLGGSETVLNGSYQMIFTIDTQKPSESLYVVIVELDHEGQPTGRRIVLSPNDLQVEVSGSNYILTAQNEYVNSTVYIISLNPGAAVPQGQDDPDNNNDDDDENDNGNDDDEDNGSGDDEDDDDDDGGLQLTSGEFDATFNDDGVFSENVNMGQVKKPKKMSYQSTGDLLVLSSDANNYLWRIDSEGQIDSAFASGNPDALGGFLMFDPNDINNIAEILVDSMDRIYVVGTRGPGEWLESVVLRLNANGTYDNTFGVDGLKALPNSDTWYLTVAAIDASDSLWIGGTVNYYPHVFKVSTDGTVASVLDLDATVSHQVGAISVQADGKIIAVVNENGNEAIADLVKVCRILTNGSLDNSFATGGCWSGGAASHGIPNARSYGVGTDSDGRVVVNLVNYGLGDPVLFRFLSNGTLDASFGTDGFLSVSGLSIGHTIVRPSGYIYICGVRSGSPNELTVARYNASGLDLSYGAGGYALQGSIETGGVVAKDCTYHEGTITAGGHVGTETHIIRVGE